MRRLKINWIMAAGALLIVLCGCAREPAARTSREFLAFDTVVQLTVIGRSQRGNNQVLDEAEKLCRHYDDTLSMTRQGSDIYRFNAAQDSLVPVEPDTAETVKIGLHYSALSGGVFDISVAPLSRLWKQAMEQREVPGEAEILQALSQVDYRQVSVRGSDLYKQSGTALDLGGIAKGYIADRLADFFLEQGVGSALINLGGNVLAVGEKPDGSAWLVGLEKPFAGAGELLGYLQAKDVSVVTSGVSQRYFVQDGKLYHHLLDTSSGYPVDNGLYSVSILSPLSVEAEALSTVCFLLGLEEGMALLEDLPGVHGIFVTEDDTIYTTEGLEAAYEIRWE